MKIQYRTPADVLSPDSVKRFRQQWYEENAPLGKLLGYPDCCIQAFCDDPPQILKRRVITAEDKMRYKAACIDGKYTGFIPCAIHAKEILEGKITLASLIKDRDESQMGKFPTGFVPQFTRHKYF